MQQTVEYYSFTFEQITKIIEKETNQKFRDKLSPTFLCQVLTHENLLTLTPANNFITN